MGVTRAATFEFSGVKSPMRKQIRSLSTLYCYAKTKSAAIVEALIKKDVLEKCGFRGYVLPTFGRLTKVYLEGFCKILVNKCHLSRVVLKRICFKGDVI